MPRVIYRDPRLREIAQDLGLGVADALQLDVEVQGEDAVTGHPISLLIELGDTASTANVFGDSFWPLVGRAVQGWAASVRSTARDRGTAREHFWLRATWGAEQQHELIIWDTNSASFGVTPDALERIAAQLAPLGDVIAPAMTWWEDTDDPPTAVRVQGQVGAEHSGSWTVGLHFGGATDGSMPGMGWLSFSVKADQSVTWFTTPRRAVPPIITPDPRRPPDEQISFIPAVRPGRDPDRLVFHRYLVRVWLWFRDEPVDVPVTTALGEYKAVAMAAGWVRRDPDARVEAIEILSMSRHFEPDPDALHDYNEVG